MHAQALLIGNSDGIGLAATRRLLASGWQVAGISRSESPVAHANYEHRVADVGSTGYAGLLDDLVSQYDFDLCVYLAGIGELLDLGDMRHEPRVMEVNLTGMVRTAAVAIPRMVERGRGHFIGVSSVADALYSAEAPSYHASKAGFSHYLRSLSFALKPTGVRATNLRFGFVDTKMAKADIKPFMLSIDKAVDRLEYCMRKKPVCYTAPKIVIPLVLFLKLVMRLKYR